MTFSLLIYVLFMPYFMVVIPSIKFCVIFADCIVAIILLTDLIVKRNGGKVKIINGKLRIENEGGY